MEREFHPYSRPKSRRHESQIDNALKRWSFSLRANFSWLKRRFKRGFRSRKKRRTAADFIKPRRRTNFRIIAFTVAVLGLAALLVPQWRERQLRLATASMLTRAKALEGQQKFREAAQAAHEFVKLRPNSTDGTAVLAHCYALVAKSSEEHQQAAEFFSKALSLDSENIELRRQFAAFLFEGKFEDRYKRAEGQAEKLLAVDNNDSPAWRILALSLYQQSRAADGPAVSRVIEALKSAVAHNPTDVELASTLARIYRSDIAEFYAGERQSLADEVMDYLVQSAPNSPDALLARYKYRLRYRVPGADADLDLALSLAPDNDDVLTAAGEYALLRGRFQDARGPLSRLLSISTSDRRAYLGLALSHLGMGEAPEAVELLERSRREGVTRDAHLAILFGRALTDSGDVTQAAEVLDQAETLVGNVPAFDDKAPNPDYEFALCRRAAWLFARAELAAKQFEYSSAVGLLQETQRAMGAIAAESDLWLSPLTAIPSAAQVAQLLAQCYTAQGQPESAAGAYNELRNHDPKNPAPALAEARAWLAAQRYDRAQLAVDVAGTLSESPEAWLKVARAHLEIQAALPTTERRWQACEGALAQAKKTLRPTAGLLLTEAAILREQGSDEPALALIEQARTLAPGSTDALRSLLEAHAEAGRFEAATAALDDFEKLNGTSDQTLAARVQLTAAQGDLPAAIEQLRSLRATTPVARRLPRSLQLVRLHLQAGQLDGARRLLRELVDESPKNKRLLLLAANLALQAGDVADLAQGKARIEELEGPEGLNALLLEARHLLLASPEGPPPPEVDKLLADLSERGGDPQGLYIVRGLLAERRGATTVACDALQAALRLGDHEPTANRSLYRLLAREGRLLELADLLGQLGRRRETAFSLDEDVEGSADFSQVLMSTALPSAAAEARRRPDDPLSGAWLAQLLALAGKSEDSRKLIADVWQESRGTLEAATAALAWANFQRDQALLTGVIKRLNSLDEIPPTRRTFLLAQAQQLAHDDAAAESSYRLALNAAADDPVVAAAAAKFFVGRDRTAAAETLAGALGAVVSPVDPRRALLRILSDHGQSPDWRSAWLEAFHPAARAPADVADDPYARVVRAIKQGGPAELDAAAALLSARVDHEQSPLPDDRFLLAALLEARGRLKDAREQFVRLLAESDDRPVYVAGYVEMLLRYNNLEEAASWLETLQKLAPQDPEATSLHARLLGLQGRVEEIEPVVEKQLDAALALATDELARSRALRFAAETYASVGNSDGAERSLRRLADLNRGAFEPLCQWLVAQGRGGEAIDTCLAALGDSPRAEGVAALARLVCDGRVQPDDYQKAAPLLDKATQTLSQDHPALSAAAHAARYHSDNALAQKLLRAALAVQPDSVETLANLAVVLAEEGSATDEIQQLIERAKSHSSGSAMALDAEGQTLIYWRRLPEAIEVLTLANQASAQPASLLHLATALFRHGDLTGARAALVQAKASGLTRNTLLPLDRQALSDLDRALGGK